MAYKIIIKKRFAIAVDKLLTYLEKEWGNKVVHDFIHKLEASVAVLQEQPFIGAESTRYPGIRSISITKHNRLVYRVSNNRVIILNLYDTRRKDKAK